MADLPRRPYLNSAVCGCVLASDGTTMTTYPCEGHRTAGTGVSVRAAAGGDHRARQENGYRYYRKLYEATGDLANLDRMREYVTEPGGMDVAAEAWGRLDALFRPSPQRLRPVPGDTGHEPAKGIAVLAGVGFLTSGLLRSIGEAWPAFWIWAASVVLMVVAGIFRWRGVRRA